MLLYYNSLTKLQLVSGQGYVILFKLKGVMLLVTWEWIETMYVEYNNAKHKYKKKFRVKSCEGKNNWQTWVMRKNVNADYIEV